MLKPAAKRTDRYTDQAQRRNTTKRTRRSMLFHCRIFPLWLASNFSARTPAVLDCPELAGYAWKWIWEKVRMLTDVFVVNSCPEIVLQNNRPKQLQGRRNKHACYCPRFGDWRKAPRSNQSPAMKGHGYLAYHKHLFFFGERQNYDKNRHTSPPKVEPGTMNENAAEHHLVCLSFVTFRFWKKNNNNIGLHKSHERDSEGCAERTFSFWLFSTHDILVWQHALQNCRKRSEIISSP